MSIQNLDVGGVPVSVLVVVNKHFETSDWVLIYTKFGNTLTDNVYALSVFVPSKFRMCSLSFRVQLVRDVCVFGFSEFQRMNKK